MKPTPGSPGFNQVVLPPTYPKGTLLSPDGTLTSSPGYRFFEQNNAMAGWQNTLVPPVAPISVDNATKELGRCVFERAGCANCHSGPFLTNNRVVPSVEPGANTARSRALAKTQANFATPPIVYSFDAMTPPAPNAPHLIVPTGDLDQNQIDLACAPWFEWRLQGPDAGGPLLERTVFARRRRVGRNRFTDAIGSACNGGTAFKAGSCLTACVHSSTGSASACDGESR